MFTVLRTFWIFKPEKLYLVCDDARLAQKMVSNIGAELHNANPEQELDDGELEEEDSDQHRTGDPELKHDHDEQ